LGSGEVEYCAFEHLVSAINPGLREDEVYALLRAYLDESGTHDNAPALAVAGFLASAESWHRLDRHWRQFLAEEKLEFLHMTDMENCREQFSGYRDADKERVVKRAHCIISESKATQFGSVVKRDDFREIVMGNPEAFKKIGSSYSLCGSTVVHQVAAWARRKDHKGPIQFIFGDLQSRIDGIKVKGEMIDLFSQYKKIKFFRSYFFVSQDPIWADMKKVRPVQAADIAAYELAKYTNFTLGMEPKANGVRASLKNLLTQVAFDNQGYWNRENLAALVRRVTEDEVDMTNESSMRQYLED
jgi:hypothetical protein